MPKPIIFSISINDRPRALFSVQERLSGDLTIIMKRFAYSPKELTDFPLPEDKLVEERFSIHTSPASKYVNVIKYTNVTKGSVHITRNYTRAIKIRNCFSAVFARLVGDVSYQQHLDNLNKIILLSLGSYDPVHFHLMYFVIVGPKDRNFFVPSDSKVNLIQHEFRHFRLVVLWQFFVFPARRISKTYAG